MVPALGLSPGSSVLCVVPHPDDETIGCGGTIARLADEGVRVYVCAISVGDLPLLGGASSTTVRLSEFDKAMTALGVTGAEICWTDDERHSRLDLVPQLDLIQLVEFKAKYSLATIRPDAVLMPAKGCMHQDHRAVHYAAFSAVRPHSTAFKHVPSIVLGFVTPEEHGWSALVESRAVSVDTSEYWERKEAALTAYASQLKAGGHPRAIGHIRNLDAAAGGKLGWRYAEEFVCYRMAYSA